MLGWGTHETVGPATSKQLLDGAGTFNLPHPDQGEHAEGDLSDQLLALVDGTQVKMMFPISSGKPSTPTILGSYHVYLQRRVIFPTECTSLTSSSAVHDPRRSSGAGLPGESRLRAASDLRRDHRVRLVEARRLGRYLLHLSVSLSDHADARERLPCGHSATTLW